VARDFQLKAKLLDKFPGHEAEVIENLELAVQKDSVQQNKAEYATRLAALYKEAGDKKNEAKWLGQLYEWKDNPTNLDFIIGELRIIQRENIPRLILFLQRTLKNILSIFKDITGEQNQTR
jgi:hypothetical protein